MNRPRFRHFAATVVLIGWATTLMAASPFDHLLTILPTARATAATRAMPDVGNVTPRALGGAFRLPLRVALAADVIRVPGDPRPYRHGVHQGTDFYGVKINEPIYPVAAGIVVRADREYVPMKTAYRQRILARCADVKATPGEKGVPFDATYGDILDQLRGRQVWVYHGENAKGLPVLSIYAHLNEVAPIKVGQFVTTNDRIGGAGNSGTSQEGVSTTREIHLHLEIYVGEDYWSLREAGERGKTLSESRTAALRKATLAAFRP